MKRDDLQRLSIDPIRLRMCPQLTLKRGLVAGTDSIKLQSLNK